MNPITGKMEWNGTSILDVADPAKPKYVWHIPNEANRNSRGVSVVYDYKFDSSGKDYLIRNSEALTEGNQQELASDFERSEDRDSDQRRRHRSPRVGVRVGSRRHGSLHPGVHRLLDDGDGLKAVPSDRFHRPGSRSRMTT